jgi:hypothetical protein
MFPFNLFAIPQRLAAMHEQLLIITTRLTTMSAPLDTLIDRVTAIETVGDAAITLLAGLKTQLDEAIASADADALAALSDRLGAQANELAAAITANTPAAPLMDPEPVPEPEPEPLAA